MQLPPCCRTLVSQQIVQTSAGISRCSRWSSPWISCQRRGSVSDVTWNDGPRSFCHVRMCWNNWPPAQNYSSLRRIKDRWIAVMKACWWHCHSMIMWLCAVTIPTIVLCNNTNKPLDLKLAGTERHCYLITWVNACNRTESNEDRVKIGLCVKMCFR